MYLHTTDYKFKHIYDINELKNYSEMAARDIQRCEEVINNIKKYQMAIFEHVQEVINTEIKNIVVLHRSTDYSTNKKRFDVYLDARPVVEKQHIEGSAPKGRHSFDKHFEGRERHLALKYADDLAKQYNCEIEKKGFKY